MHCQRAHVFFGVATVDGLDNLRHRGERLERLLRRGPPPLSAQWLRHRSANLVHVRIGPLHTVIQTDFVVTKQIRHVDFQPPQPNRTQLLGLVEHHNAAAKVVSEVTQVRWDGVRASAEINIVRKEHNFVFELLRNVELDGHIATNGMHFAVLLGHTGAQILVKTLIKPYFIRVFNDCVRIANRNGRRGVNFASFFRCFLFHFLLRLAPRVVTLLRSVDLPHGAKACAFLWHGQRICARQFRNGKLRSPGIFDDSVHYGVDPPARLTEVIQCVEHIVELSMTHRHALLRADGFHHGRFHCEICTRELTIVPALWGHEHGQVARHQQCRIFQGQLRELEELCRLHVHKPHALHGHALPRLLRGIRKLLYVEVVGIDKSRHTLVVHRGLQQHVNELRAYFGLGRIRPHLPLGDLAQAVVE
mmetsp:Transcript_60813/g.106854  ORF Transcript_60813/g.106854 Transcript_60813/m.106854 type:complete len:418 (-) Transcript_60813:977-2230(-)